LRPFQEQVHERFSAWLAQQETSGRKFTDEQRQWLGLIRDHIASSLAIERDDFEYVPFAQHGGLGKAYQVFGQHLTPLLNELNEVLVA
jgi:type I restriction enzyme R subunit